MADDDKMGTDDIAAMFAAKGMGGPAKAAAPAARPAPVQADSNMIDPNELEALLMGAGAAAPPPPVATAPKPKPKPSAPTKAEQRATDLLNRVDAGLDAVMRDERSGGRSKVTSNTAGTKPYELADFAGSPGSRGRTYELQSLDDVELDLHIELGRAELMIEEVMNLKEGAVVQLDKMAGDPVDIVVNGRLLARGEVLVLNDNFCVRVAEIVTPDY